MPARKVKVGHNPEVRDRIRTSQLLNRLQNNALGKLELNAIEQKSIEILLRKVIPDLSSVEQKTDININVEHYVSAKPLSTVDWQSTYGPKHLTTEAADSSLVPPKRPTNGAH